MPPRQVIRNSQLRDMWRYIDADPDIPIGQANLWKQTLTDVDNKLAEHASCPPAVEVSAMVKALAELKLRADIGELELESTNQLCETLQVQNVALGEEVKNLKAELVVARQPATKTVSSAIKAAKQKGK